MASNQGRQVFFGNGMFKVPANVTRVRVIADCTAFSRFATEKSASYLLDANGQLWAWGLNANGQLGINNVTAQSSPVAVVGGQKFVNFWVPKTNTYPQTFAIDQNGQLFSWGLNGSFPVGLLGQNQGTAGFACSSPILVAGSGLGVGKVQYAQVFTGYGNIFALDVNGNLWGWGTNSTGQCGSGTNGPTNLGGGVSSPVMVTGGIKWQWCDAESFGSGTIFGIDVNNNLWSWGSNAGGMLGIGTGAPASVSSPVKVVGLGPVRKVMGAALLQNFGIGIAAGVAFALDFQGRVWTWGNNTYGQAGVAAPYNIVNSSPVLVSFPAGVQIRDLAYTMNASASDSAFYALDYNGNVWAWGFTGGNANSGALGNGNFNSSNTLGSSTPTLVLGGHNINKIFTKANGSAGSDTVFAMDANGAIWGWGNNTNAALGNNSGTLNQSIPVAVSGNNRFIWMDWDSAFTGAIMACDFYGQLWAWGWNNFGATGNGITVQTTGSSPVQVLLQKVVQMNNPQQDYFFDVIPGQSIPVIFGGLYTQFADKLVGPVPHTNLPQSASATAASPLTLIANRITVEYDQ